MGMRPRNIHLNIKKIMLRDMTAEDADIIKDAMKDELKKLFRTKGVPGSLDNSGNQNSLSIGPINTGYGSGGKEVGGEVARAIYSGLSKK